MATIPLSDKFGLDVNAQPADGSALLKYFQQIPSLKLTDLDLSKVGGLTLDQPAIQSVSTGVSLQDPVNLGSGVPSLTIGAGAHASFALITDLDDLPGQEPGMTNPPDSCYVSFAVEASASPGVSVTSGDLTFGATPSAEVVLTSYSRIAPKSGVTLLDGVKQAVAQFRIAGSASDLAAFPAGQISKAALTGKLTLSGDANLLAITNPLAAASLPAPLPVVTVSAGGSATIGVSCTIETEYEIVARKLDSGKVRLGWYHKNGTSVTVSAAVSESLAAGFNGSDLFSQVIGLVSADPKVDLKELTSAGIPEEEAEQVQSAVKACVCRKLQIAVSSSVTASQSEAATFLFELDPARWTDTARQAVDAALRGDLSGLHAENLPGVAAVRTIWDTVSKRGLELDVNLLGVLNYRSVASLALEGKVMYEPATGAMVITDQATAQRVQSLQLNFGADTGKLRKVLAESFLITAAYRGTQQLAGAASLRCSHRFFELQHSTSNSDMARKLECGFALGLLSAEEATAPVAVSDFGESLFSVSTDYDQELVTRMFLDGNGNPQPREWYETVGRNAIQYLVREGDEDDVRRQPAIDDTLWKRMKDVGQPGFGSLFLGVSAPLLGAVTADYTAIVWWADAMENTARLLANFAQWTARNSSASPDDPGFESLRQGLASHLRQVAATTHDEFGQPWGLIAMNQLVGHTSGAKLILSSTSLVRSKSRDLAAVTGK